MNRQPISYMQTDPRWAGADYSAVGERTDIRESGCGPTCAAMLIETISGQEYTPADACAWALRHGYKAPHQGTYYSYFTPQFKAFGLECRQLNGGSVYGQTGAAVNGEALSLLKEGYYLIACMGRGLWTSSGHFVVVWWEDGQVYINDPASTAPARLRGDPAVFRAQVKYYWAVDARVHNRLEEDEEMKLYRYASEVPEWARASVEKAVANGYIGMDATGAMGVWETNLQTLVWMDRAGVLDKPAGKI